MSKSQKAWRQYLANLPPASKNKMLRVAIERLMESEEVHWSEGYPGDKYERARKPCIVWTGSGNSLLK